MLCDYKCFTSVNYRDLVTYYLQALSIVQITNKTSNLEVDLLSNTAGRRCTVLASIAMQIKKEIHCSISEINEKTLKFGYLIPCKSLDYLF